MKIKILFLFLALFLIKPVYAIPPFPNPPASSTQSGTVELATDAETITGTATDKACTPANVQAKLDDVSTATPTASKIPIADGSGRLTDWTPNKVKTVTSTPVTLTEAEIKHGVVLVNTGASVINLPAGSAALDGFPCVFTSIAAVSYSVDPNGSEVITKMGSDMTGGNKLTASGVAGESFKLIWDNTNSKWREYDETGVITDGGS